MQMRRLISTTFRKFTIYKHRPNQRRTLSNHRTQQRDGSSKEFGPRRKAGNPLRPSRSTSGAARPHMFLKRSLPRHAVLNRRPSAQKDHGKTRCAIGAAPEEMWHWIWLLRLIGRCTSFYRHLNEGAERRAPGRQGLQCLDLLLWRRTFVVVGCSFCCFLEAVQPHMISPDDKRLGARPARPLQGWIALMTKKLGDLRRVALRREILACKFGGPPRPLLSTCP